MKKVEDVYGHRESVNLGIRGMLITYCVCDFFVLWVPLNEERKRDLIMPEKLCSSTH